MASSPHIKAPTFEHHHSGLGLSHGKPRLSWSFISTELTANSWFQTAYEIEIAFGAGTCQSESFRIESSESVLVPWPARALRSREAASARVRVSGKGDGQDTQLSEWSQWAVVESALLEPSDFKAQFITSAAGDTVEAPLRPIRFKRTFDLSKGQPYSHSRLYITSLGVFNVWINGRLAGDECMAPGWTSYKHRLVYRTLDISSMLIPGARNCIAAEVAEGWYAGRLGFGGGTRFLYGQELGLFAQLEVGDGTSEPWTLLTDETWSAMASAILTSEIYDGEVLDLGQEVDAWADAATEWPAVLTLKTKILPKPSARLVAPDAPPVRITERISLQKTFKSRSGKTILDFGQNIVGKLCIPQLELHRGQTLTLRHAEVMENGELGVRPLRQAKATDIVIGSTNSSPKSWTPRYTFHGFRYVEVTGWPAEDISTDDIYAVVIHTDMKRRGYLETSNQSVNKLHRNVVWSMRGNFISIPTDCPQRDERMGWTGDLQAFSPTATFLYDTVGILGNWLEDMAAEQLEDNGVVPLVVPDCMPLATPKEANSQAVWGDVAILVPNAIYQYSADKDLLMRQFESMQAWLDRGVVRAPDGLWEPSRFQLADWLDPNAPPEDPARAATDAVLVANAYLVHVTLVFSSLCSAMGKCDLAQAYYDAAEDLRSKFQRRYITPDGNLVSVSQTGIALAVYFNLYPDKTAVRKITASTLSNLVRKARFNISTGFAGTPVIAHALTTICQPQLAYRMLLETGCPSWMYPVVKHDATTIWERWDSMLRDGSINPGEMTSFNHYALGAVADWLHCTVGGISPFKPGWKTIRVRPVPGGNIAWCKCSFDGPYGLVDCHWTIEGDRFWMSLTVPPNCTAAITLPSEICKEHENRKEEPIRHVGSGIHEFSCQFNAGEWPPTILTHTFMQQPEEQPLAE